MNNKWIDENFKLKELNKNYSVYEYDYNGKGKLISYNVFDGIDVVFMEFETCDIFIPEAQHNEVIEVSWCKKGRVECEFSNRSVSYLQEGDFGINASSYIPIHYNFPFYSYEAVSLVINLKECSEETIKLLKYFSVDIRLLFTKLNLEKNFYITRENYQLKHLFSEFYDHKEKDDGKYFAIKTTELLYYINSLSRFDCKKISYYRREQIEKVKEIRNYLINTLDKKISIEKYVRDSGIGLTTFRGIFLQIYGDTPTAYLIKYKMALASKLLDNKSLSIMSIALSLGYSNPSKFSSAFRRQYGVLPKDYKKL